MSESYYVTYILFGPPSTFTHHHVAHILSGCSSLSNPSCPPTFNPNKKKFSNSHISPNCSLSDDSRVCECRCMEYFHTLPLLVAGNVINPGSEVSTKLHPQIRNKDKFNKFPTSVAWSLILIPENKIGV